MLNRFRMITLIFSAMVLPNAYSAGFVPVYLDGEDEGYKDITVVISDITGLSTTLGEDRKACFEAVLAVLATHLDITVDILVEAEFNSLGGDADNAVLGGAGPISSAIGFANAPEFFWFTIAEANQISGSDIFSTDNDIFSEFNSAIDGGGVLGTTTWYYGIDGNVPPDHIDFFSTVLHELCHGLGFITFMIQETGSLFLNIPDIYTSFLRREGSVNLDYLEMDNAQRADGNISVSELVWNGAVVEAEHGSKPLMYAPDPVVPPNAVSYPHASVNHWHTSNSPNLLMEPLATDAFTDLTLERQLFDDIHWPMLPLGDPLDPNNVFVQFDASPNGNGASTSPFNNLTDAVAAANNLANINMDTGAYTDTFTGGLALGTDSKAHFLLNNTPGSGVVTIGAAPPSLKSPESGFVTRK